jgi:hypothetical protein
MLSLIGSLLSDPSNPPPPPSPALHAHPLHVSRSPSLTPEFEVQVAEYTDRLPKAKKARLAKATNSYTLQVPGVGTDADTGADANAAQVTPSMVSISGAPTTSAAVGAGVAAPSHSYIDPSTLSARDLKKLRKEEAKAKRDARKARKDGDGDGDGDADGGVQGYIVTNDNVDGGATAQLQSLNQSQSGKKRKATEDSSAKPQKVKE